ncbi:MAG: sporulation protein Cse60 [Alistipes sp.]
MIKVKTFTMNNSKNVSRHEILDNDINKWLEEHAVEVVDIKYSIGYYKNAMGSGCWYASAMLIYKEK